MSSSPSTVNDFNRCNVSSTGGIWSALYLLGSGDKVCECSFLIRVSKSLSVTALKLQSSQLKLFLCGVSSDDYTLFDNSGCLFCFLFDAGVFS